MKDNALQPRLHILLIDNRVFERPALLVILRLNYKVTVSQTAEEAIPTLLDDPPAMIIIDAGEQNMEFLSLIEEYDQQTPLLLVGQHPDDEYAGDGFNRSALKMWIEHTITSRKLKTQVASLEAGDTKVQSFASFITCNQTLFQIFRTLQRVLDTDVPVLITGESGTGKELIAQGIHNQSKRMEQPFVALNCAAIPETLLETELFGYEKGAFTGATAPKIGKLEYAGEGTIFLDEIGDMPLLTQAKLLRAIQERAIERVGGHKSIPFKARILAATNKNLPEEIQRRAFREDLFYRLNTVHVELPSLRERREDIPLLIMHFLKAFSQRYDKNILGISPTVLHALQKYDWPGNVRELVNIVHHAVLLSDGPRIELKDLPAELRFGRGIIMMLDQVGKVPLDALVEQAKNDFERQIITLVLEKFNYNKARSAQFLGIDRKTLYRKIKTLRIQDEK
ncbi:sigma-54-dependent Fis family transcriptional regulator [Reticulibacter mediterranei]|uniref:Sigma-54-dependent Fis family transcriptional regulator n=1 Tax=Reticulibacter mediterranei TaxID=2778369 RepID=A0A8J3N9A1_9CHLR|nr:sigma-54 dependent transcriptional regulator [Reticulibacter mediterranei]GHO99092.1 sigma-54-dependent Fis family transcriptional regulator [Reticulibacter mediterranei]